MMDVGNEGESIQDPSTQLCYLFQTVYYNFIIETVKFHEILPQMHFMRDIFAEVYELHNSGKNTEAGEKFMETLKSSEEPGKYQCLMDALRQMEYFNIVDAVEKGEVEHNHEEYKSILTIFLKPITETIDPTLMSNELLSKNVISERDVEKIHNAQTNKSSYDASFYLLDALPRRNKDWFIIFLDTLYNLRHLRLCNEIDPKFYEKKKAEEEENVPASGVNESLECLDYGVVSSASSPIEAQNIYPFPGTSELNVSGRKFENECNCTCVNEVTRKFEELKSFFELKVNSLEIKLNQQSALLERLLNK